VHSQWLCEMAQIHSKLPLPAIGTLKTSCMEYVHPWTNSCLQAACGLYFYAIFDSLRIYGTVYVVCTLLSLAQSHLLM
jgi:hypothetical protein